MFEIRCKLNHGRNSKCSMKLAYAHSIGNEFGDNYIEIDHIHASVNCAIMSWRIARNTGIASRYFCPGLTYNERIAEYAFAAASSAMADCNLLYNSNVAEIFVVKTNICEDIIRRSHGLRPKYS